MKIAVRHGWASNIRPGSVFDGDTVIITALSIFTCIEKNGKYCIVGNTDPPVGLFFEEGQALHYAAANDHTDADEKRCMEEARMIVQRIIALNNPRLFIRDPLSFIYNEVYMPE